MAGLTHSLENVAKYYGIVGMVWAVAFTLGPLIGGAFTKKKYRGGGVSMSIASPFLPTSSLLAYNDIITKLIS